MFLEKKANLSNILKVTLNITSSKKGTSYKTTSTRHRPKLPYISVCFDLVFLRKNDEERQTCEFQINGCSM